MLYCAPEVLRHPLPSHIKMLQLNKTNQLRRKAECRAADVYSLGMIIYEILFRQTPFSDVDLPLFCKLIFLLLNYK